MSLTACLQPCPIYNIDLAIRMAFLTIVIDDFSTNQVSWISNSNIFFFFFFLFYLYIYFGMKRHAIYNTISILLFFFNMLSL